MFMVATYVVGLLHMYNTSRASLPIDQVTDLGTQNDIKYGMQRGGSTQSFVQVTYILKNICSKNVYLF